jgi:SLT domain-containing protein
VRIRYLAKLWRSRALAEREIAEKYEQPFAAIHYVFERYGSAAWRVALCEGGSPVPSVNARNGQFLGMFQMGAGERSRYGHSHTALGQSVAAYRYFIATGRDWSPWQCRPNGQLAW